MWSLDVTARYKDWNPVSLHLGPIKDNFYLETTLDVFLGVFSFYVATWVPTLISWANDYVLERKTPDVHVEIPAVRRYLYRNRSARRLSAALWGISQLLHRGHPGSSRTLLYNRICRILLFFPLVMDYTTRIPNISPHMIPRPA